MYASIREMSISVLPVAGVGICPRFDGTGALRVELHSRVGLFHKAGRDRVAFEKQLSRVGDLALRSIWNDHKWSWRPCCRSCPLHVAFSFCRLLPYIICAFNAIDRDCDEVVSNQATTSDWACYSCGACEMILYVLWYFLQVLSID